MANDFLPYNVDQQFLLPPDLREWLPEGHLARFVLDVVDQMDLGDILDRYRRKDPRGRSAYDPKMLVSLLLYAYCVGRPSSRKIEKATIEDVAFRVIAANQHPDHDTIAAFRRDHLKGLSTLFVKVLALCQQAGLVKLGHVALDGTKIAANASKRKAMSYARMRKTERELAEEVARLMAEAERVDRDEDARFGKGKRGDELPAELARRESRLQKIREAKAALEAEAAATRARELAERTKQAQEEAAQAPPETQPRAKRRVQRIEKQAEAAADRANEKADQAGLSAPDLAPSDLDALPSHQVQADVDGEPKPDAQRNFTDPQSRIMPSNGTFVQGYNAQLAVDDAHQIIVAQGITNQSPDAQHLRPMLNQIEANCGAVPQQMTADAGYWSESNAAYCAERGVDAYIATERLKHGEKPPAARGRVPKSLDAKGRMRRKLRTKRGRAVYAQRKAVVEPVNGQIKEVRGFRRFLMRGQERVAGELSLIAATHNLLKLFRSGWSPALAMP